MPDGGLSPGMVAVQRTELVTRDMDLYADFIREQLGIGHAARFRCDDPARVDGAMKVSMADGLAASSILLGGFTYESQMDPVDAPTALFMTQGSGRMSSGREQVSYAPGSVLMIPAHHPATALLDDGAYLMLRVPWLAAGALAEAISGLRAADLRFEALTPVSAAAGQSFARTAVFIIGQLLTSGATEVHPLILQQMTGLVAAVFLETFPNTTMTLGYAPGPGWVLPANVRRAAGFIDAYADQPVTLDQIAAVAGVSGRALQYAFRRHYGTTPIGYLRQVRLERAHAQLQAADPADGTTVAAVARQWGWASPAQFAAAYRHRFGIPPSQTLRT
jgi:AraC-like DNA-binding protein